MPQPIDLTSAMNEAVTQASAWIIIFPVILPLLGAATLLMLRRRSRAHLVLAALVTLAVLIADLQLLGRVLTDGPQSMTMGRWLPPFGISFTADILGVGFATAAAVVTLVALLYSRLEIARGDVRKGFYPLVLMLLAGVSGGFLTGDIFNLYVWFEVMLIASFGLIVLTGRPLVLDASVKYGLINFLGTSIFLLSLGLLYGLLGTLNMADIARISPSAPQGPLLIIAALLLLAFGLKAAAFPLNAWLPASYHAPPAVVSALFGGLLTKVGVYALFKAMLLMLPTARLGLEPVLALVAILTLVIAPLGAIAETHLRRAVGFLLMGGIGAALVGLVLASREGVAGSGLYAISAVLSLPALYLLSGLIERVTGSDDTRQMGGLYARQPELAILFLILVFTLAGTPPLLGFWPKLLLVDAGLADAADPWSVALLVAVLVNAFLTLIAGTRLWAHIFWRTGKEGANSELVNDDLRPLAARERWLGVLPVAALVVVMVAIGLLPDGFVAAGFAGAGDLLDPARFIAATGLEGP